MILGPEFALGSAKVGLILTPGPDFLLATLNYESSIFIAPIKDVAMTKMKPDFTFPQKNFKVGWMKCLFN